MDPLSLTASIIAVLGAGGSVASGIERIVSLHHAPDALLALNNEIVDFQLVVRMVQELLQDYESRDAVESIAYAEDLKSVLARAKEKILELDMLIQYRFIPPGTQGGLNRTAWVREQRRVKAIQDEIRSVRINLMAVIGVLTSKAASRIEFQVSKLQLMSGEIRDRNDWSQTMIDQVVGSQISIQNTLPNILEAQERTEVHINELLFAHTARAGVRSSHPESIPTSQHLPTTEGNLSQTFLHILPSRTRHSSHCNPGCVCCCHQRHTIISPHHWQSFFGLLFVGYVGLPVTPCDDIRCQQMQDTSIGFKYYFPWWFASYVLDMVIRFSKPYGLTQSLRVSRSVWADSKLFITARDGDISGLKAVLSSREGSPYDVNDSNGETALSQALKMHQVETCQILLDAGADPNHESYDRWTPKKYAWSLILRQNLPPSLQQAFQTLFPDADFDTFGFKLLHETVLGFNSLGIEEALERDCSSINHIDEFNRTPLGWAAVRGDLSAVKFLVQNGADVNNFGFSPLSMAAGPGHHHCVEVLLNHGANINFVARDGRTPLHRAVSGYSNVKTLNVLIRHGADIDALSHDEATPLNLAIYFHNFKFASKLISLGADFVKQSSAGINALCDAVLRNNQRILIKLLVRGADNTGEIREHGSFLHYVAEHASIATLRLLADARLSSRDILQKRRKDGLTALDVAKARSNMNQTWTDAFQTFLNSVDKNKNSQRTKPQPLPGTFQRPPWNEVDSEEDDDDSDTDNEEGDDFVDAPEQ